MICSNRPCHCPNCSQPNPCSLGILSGCRSSIYRIHHTSGSNWGQIVFFLAGWFWRITTKGYLFPDPLPPAPPRVHPHPSPPPSVLIFPLLRSRSLARVLSSPSCAAGG